jgi:HEAT repeat protein
VYALVKIGLEAVPVISEALKHDNEKVRRQAAWILGDIGSEAKTAVPDLTEALKNQDWIVRRRAAEALKKINTPEALKALEEYKKKSK